VHSATSDFTVSAPKGLQFGYNSRDIFKVLFETSSSNLITIRKDSFFSITAGGIKEYDQLSKTIPEGKKIGAYHIRIGRTYSDFNAVNKKIEALKILGIHIL
jgi:stage II sporulation protein D